ncbi:hypothetical protein ABPG74_012099 [Tetrahymena malaccensis]
MRSLSKEDIDKLKNIDLINSDGQKYSIDLRYIKSIEANDESTQNLDKITVNYKKGNQVTQLLNIILKSIIREENYLEIGKNSKFFEKNSRSDITIPSRNGNSVLEAYKGFTFNVTPSQDNIYIMIDFCSRIIRKETALEYITANNNQIAGLSVITKYNNYQIYLIDRVDHTKTPLSTFLNKRTNIQITFAQYYKERYGIQIRNMSQPLLVHKRKYREANTNIQKIEEVYLIPEICNMTGMTEEQRSNFQAMREVANHTKLTPQQRYQSSIRNCKFLNSKARASGIQIDENSNVIDAIQLRPPRIGLGGNRFANAEKGNFDMRAATLDKVVFKNWGIIYNKRDEKDVYDFVDNLFKKACQTYGITVMDPFYLSQKDWNVKNWIENIDEDIEQNGIPEFVLTFGQVQAGFYSELKKFFTNELGIASQHVVPRSLQKNGMSVTSKIALQIASKLGKRIWQVETPAGVDQNTMVIGIETSLKRIQNQQVIGVVASINKDFTQYFSQVDIRRENDTALPNLSKIVAKAIEAYAKNTKNIPSEVIVYRQGLGEGQIQQSFNFEIKAIQTGFNIFKAGFNPRLAFFQVNRKIGQKFYQQPSADRSEIQNPASGTIVASQIIHNNFEFFMAAQNCNSGVCTPTKYTCLYNNTNLKEDQIWQFTYYQTFNYYNWQGPVRVPAAMKYAEKLAKFTSNTLQDVSNQRLSNSLFYL